MSGYWGLTDNMILMYLLKEYALSDWSIRYSSKQEIIEEIRNRFPTWPEFNKFMKGTQGWV